MVVTAPHPARFQPTLPARGATATTRRERSEIWYFNPRSPHGERQSQRNMSFVQLRISTHAPRTGSDEYRAITIKLIHQFQPTLPARGATVPNFGSIWSTIGFQPTLPARGATD